MSKPANSTNFHNLVTKITSFKELINKSIIKLLTTNQTKPQTSRKKAIHALSIKISKYNL